MILTQHFAEFLTGPASSNLPQVAIERAQMSLASTIASAGAGYAIPSTKIIRQLETMSGGTGAATVWFDSAKLPVASAARCNATASDAAASDDSDMRSIAHIGTIISTTALAIAESRRLTGHDVLRAMVLGYEIAGRIDEALTPGRMERGFHGSVSTVFGGAVTTGTLLGLSPNQMSHAIALAATSIGGIAISADTSWAREYHAGLSASLGVNAAYAAEKGFTGERTVLDGPRGFISAMGGEITEDITFGLGESWDIVTDMAIKLMPGGHPYHAVAEAAANAAIEGHVDPANVARIILSAAQFTHLPGPIHPTDLIGAAHSITYFAAAGVADRGFRWEHITNADKMLDPSICQLLEKVELDPSPPPLPDRFPHRHGATVTIVMKNGQRYSHTCKSPKGSGARGIEWVDIDSKYKKLVSLSGLSAAAIDTTLNLIHEFNSVEHVLALSESLSK